MVDVFNELISTIKDDGLYKQERSISTPQSINIETDKGVSVLNFCANNYLGLANHPNLINSAKNALDQYGFGMASVRFIFSVCLFVVFVFVVFMCCGVVFLCWY